MLATTLRLGLLFIAASAIPIDNGVEGEPEIECGPMAIAVNFNTRNPFEGRVYVKGLYDHDECRNIDGGRQVAGIELSFDTCNVARTRSLNPRGVFVTTTVVVSFHPQFVTKVDRAYRIQCFYMEADKTVSTQLEVSDLTTAIQTQYSQDENGNPLDASGQAIVPMPICRYEILDGGPFGDPIQFAVIGQQVYHKWTCDSETQNTFCAVVHSCTVDDGNGDVVQILNDDGCALDKFLLNNLEYPTDLVAGQEAHVYKYADRSQLFYQCQISISVKEPDTECARPQCPEPIGFNAIKQTTPKIPPELSRVLRKRDAGIEDVLDVRAELGTVEILDGQSEQLPTSIHERTHQTDSKRSLISLVRMHNGICLSPFGFTVILVFTVAMITISVAAVGLCVRTYTKQLPLHVLQ